MTEQKTGPDISQSSLVQRSQHQTSAGMPDETVILNPVSGVYFGLDEVGARVWELIETPRTVTELCEAITQEYAVAAEQCKQDLIKLLRELAAAGLVEIEDGATR